MKDNYQLKRERAENSKGYLTRDELPKGALIVSDAHNVSKETLLACLNDIIAYNQSRQ